MADTDIKAPDDDAPPQGMTILSVLFSFYGRIGRARYWLGFGIVCFLLLATLVTAAQFMDPTGATASAGLAVPVFFLTVWVHVAVTIKRMRDAGLPGFGSVLFALAPFLLLGFSLELIEAAGIAVGLVQITFFVLPGLLPTRTARLTQSRPSG